MPSSTSHAWLRALVWPIALAILTVLSYSPVVNMPFYAEDPLDLGQVRQSDLTEILFTNASQVYYRPLTFLLMKASELPDGTFRPLPFHVAHLAAHTLNVALMFWLTRQLAHQDSVAILAALLLAWYPYSYDAVARATPQQPFIITGLLLSLLLYLKGRLDRNRRWLGASAMPLLMAYPLLENALLFGLSTIALEAMLVLRRQVPRMSLFPLVHLVAAVPFGVIWFLIPKEGAALGLRFDPRVGDLLIRAALWPMTLLGDLLAINEQASGLLLAAGIVAIVLIFWWGRALSWLLLPISIWFVGSFPVWVASNYPYVQISPRVLYVTVPGLALLWAGLLTFRFDQPMAARLYRAGASVVVTLIAAQCLSGLLALQQLYNHGSQLMWHVTQAAERAGSTGRLVFVDVPDRMVLKEPPWPFGWWGMLLAPVSVDLGQYSDLISGTRPETRSYSAPAISATDREAWPYHTDTRGVIASADVLYDSARWADTVYRTRFAPDGSMTLEEAGAVLESNAKPVGRIARFADIAELLSVEAQAQAGRLRVTLHWRSIGAARPHDTIFVHIYHASKLIAQSDGDSLGNLVPLTTWRHGDIIKDVRMLDLPAEVAGDEPTIGVGLYNRVTAERIAAYDAAGSPLPDNVVLISVAK